MDTHKSKIFGAKINVDGTGKLAERSRPLPLYSLAHTPHPPPILHESWLESLFAERGVAMIEHIDFEGGRQRRRGPCPLRLTSSLHSTTARNRPHLTSTLTDGFLEGKLSVSVKHPYLRTPSAFSAVIQLYARSSQLSTVARFFARK
ncbi:hypothetical protein K488DRAFT_89759 [Vararia minispora EC-137]|uniref:Uncharacterized protein n=1 Tax=Vararia minispora EC-137 TaxID=1314806 RepID=A0ACB8Q9C8_9AGAM|nr:hypothetical protein K488DRAFT_89759 [Vararia minispora EC-137]